MKLSNCVVLYLVERRCEMKKYDYLIVGAGLFGATFAREMSAKGKTCLVIDRRPHIAGNAYTEEIDGIHVHMYGAHILHTDDKFIWEYVQRFADFIPFVNSPLARYGDELYNLPFNMNTFRQLWGVVTPTEAQAIIERQRAESGIVDPKNLEEQALFLVGRDIYKKFIKGYTEKQWGRACSELPADIIKRVPFRFTYDNNYFNSRFQGIPEGGFTQMTANMLKDCEVLTGCDYFGFIKPHADARHIAAKTIYTGAIDEFFGYQYGALEYRSLRFETNTMETENFQGNAVINYTAADIPYTRVVEHKHFEYGKQKNTVITHEYPATWEKGLEPYYPINNEKNNALYARYKRLAETRSDVCFGGRLGQYAYIDMDKAIANALELAKSL